MSVREAARRAGVNERTVRRVIADARLRAVKIDGAYRIDPSDLAVWMDIRAGTGERGARASEVRADTTGMSHDSPPDARAVIARLESEVTFLREALTSEMEARRRADILVAGLMERLPEITAHASQSSPEPPGRVETPSVDDLTLREAHTQPVPANEGLWQRLWRAISGG